MRTIILCSLLLVLRKAFAQLAVNLKIEGIGKHRVEINKPFNKITVVHYKI